MSNRRKLRPHEMAKFDQRRAEARERARAGQTVIVTDYANDGQQCSWCDCPVSARHAQPGYVCDGCPEPAAYVMTLGYGTDDASRYPVCERHHPRFATDMIALLRPGTIELAPPWEDDDPEVPR